MKDWQAYTIITVGATVFATALGLVLFGALDNYKEEADKDFTCEDIKSKIYVLMEKIDNSNQIDIRDLYSNEVLSWKALYDIKRCPI